MGVQEVIKFVADYGALIVIAGIFLYAAIRLVNLGIKFLEKKVSSKNHDKWIDVRHTVGESVQGLITEYLKSHDAERVNVVEFSNSVLSVAYLPFKYMTCTYEVYSLGEHSTAAAIEKLPTSLFINFFQEMYENGDILLDPNHPDPHLGGTIYDVLCSSGDHKVLCMPMKTAKGKVIGYISVDNDVAFTGDDSKDLATLCAKVCALLSVADK